MLMIPKVIIEGSTEEITLMVKELLYNQSSVGTTSCMPYGACDNISNAQCSAGQCIVSAGNPEEDAFIADPVQWLIDNEFITKGQALAITLGL